MMFLYENYQIWFLGTFWDKILFSLLLNQFFWTEIGLNKFFVKFFFFSFILYYCSIHTEWIARSAAYVLVMSSTPFNSKKKRKIVWLKGFIWLSHLCPSRGNTHFWIYILFWRRNFVKYITINTLNCDTWKGVFDSGGNAPRSVRRLCSSGYLQGIYVCAVCFVFMDIAHFVLSFLWSLLSLLFFGFALYLYFFCVKKNLMFREWNLMSYKGLT